MSTSADIDDIEEGLKFQPKFDASGLVTCVATDAGDGEVLMVAHMNDEALRKTIAAGRPGTSAAPAMRCGERAKPPAMSSAWSRCAWIAIRTRSGSGSSSQAPPATPAAARASTARSTGGEGGARLSFVDADRLFDPKAVYGNEPSFLRKRDVRRSNRPDANP